MDFKDYSPERAINTLNNSLIERMKMDDAIFDIGPKYPQNSRILPKNSIYLNNGKKGAIKKNNFYNFIRGKLDFDQNININRTQIKNSRNQFINETQFDNFDEFNNHTIFFNNSYIKVVHPLLNEEHKNRIETITIRSSKLRKKKGFLNKSQIMPQKKYNAELILYLYPENNYIKLRSELNNKKIYL